MSAPSGDYPMHRRRRNRALRKAAEHLAYEVWQYEKPNAAAVENATAYLFKARRALEAAGLVIDLPTENNGSYEDQP